MLLSMQPELDYKELGTPSGHGDTLVVPSLQVLPELVESNRQLLEGHEFGVLDMSSREARGLSRETFGAGLRSKAWIVTGHQPEFTHAGVWAKHVVTQRLAERVGGVAANLVVDHDAIKSTALRVPARVDGRYRATAVSFAPYRAGVPWESLAPLSPVELEAFARQVREAYGPRYDSSLMGPFFAAAGEVRHPRSWVDQQVAGRRAIDAVFGIDLREKHAHEVWGGPFLAQMLVDAERFVACYNDALDEYRRRLHIKGDRRPVPNLLHRDGRVELPVWAVRAGQPRLRVFCQRRGEAVHLFAEDDPIAELPLAGLRRWETAEPLLEQLAGIRPRALTLTIWARLLLADLFIHGIGGAKYDRITDVFIQKYFRLEPPAICAVSATLRLDLPAHPTSPKDLLATRLRLRDVRHNPQRYLPRTREVEPLLAEENELVGRSEWLRMHRPDDRFARRDVYDQIQDIKMQLVEFEPGILEQFRMAQERVQQELGENKVVTDREYFIGLFRREDLQYLCDALPGF